MKTIYLDLDDVLVDFQPTICHHLYKLTGRSLSYWNIRSREIMSDHGLGEILFTDFLQELSKTSDPAYVYGSLPSIKSSIEYAQTLLDTELYTIKFITARPDVYNLVNVTRWWLVGRLGSSVKKCDIIFAPYGKKHEIVEGAPDFVPTDTVVVDDDMNNLIGYTTKVTKVLFNRPWHPHIHQASIHTINYLDEIQRFL